MAALIVKTGPRAGQRLELERDLVLGRGEVDVVIDDDELSRQHLAVRENGGTVEIEDLGSLNGTWLDGARIERPTVLRAGSVIKLGTTTLELETEATFAPPPAASPASVPPAVPVGAPARPFAPAGGTPTGGTSTQTRGGQGARKRRRGVATRLVVPALLTFLTVIGTAGALIVYFALR